MKNAEVYEIEVHMVRKLSPCDGDALYRDIIKVGWTFEPSTSNFLQVITKGRKRKLLRQHRHVTAVPAK